MDKFRIHYRCNQVPDYYSGLQGFSEDKNYEGRAYNGLFEISDKWGSDQPTILLDRKEFEKYFELQKSDST